ncbi:MAG: hypothetical protein MJY61_00195 [Bacteroidales bacterium]|nr:hypothetical protein [Bacteroidales bacterium]
MWWITVSLILLGIVLMLIEMLLIPGVGIAGFLSLASMGASCWYAFTYCGRTAGIITVAVVVLSLLAMLMVILREKTWKKFELGTEIDSKVNGEVSSLLPGERGKTLTRLAPMGSAQFVKGTFEVKSHDNSMVSPGVEVEVLKIEDNKVIVKPLN